MLASVVDSNNKKAMQVRSKDLTQKNDDTSIGVRCSFGVKSLNQK